MEHIPSHDFPVEQGNSVFLLKYGVNFKKKKKRSFSLQTGGQDFWGKFMEGEVFT